jgi:multiple sugar transport system permease protein
MDANHIPEAPVASKVLKETKNKIRVEFERTPLMQRLKAKFLSSFFLQKVLWYIVRLVLLIGISYVILFPFIAKIFGSFMSMEDFVDVTVRLIPKNWTLDTYAAIILENNYLQAFVNTTFLSLACAILQTLVCCVIGYGLAKFRFRGGKLIMLFVVLTMIIPHRTIQLALYQHFRYFDIFGIINLISGGTLQLTNTDVPLMLLSLTGLAFKNGLFIFMMRQFFAGVPDELEESAYVDGSGVYRTFLQIILPLSVPMMITIFLLSFSWQWTDNFYTTLFYSGRNAKWLMPNIVSVPPSLVTNYAGQGLFYSAINNTCALLIMAPLVVIYLFCQRYLIQGIERSGIVG